MHSSRRQLLGLAGAAAIHAASTRPELILANGNIHTVDPANPHAQAVAIAGGRFFAVGWEAGYRIVRRMLAEFVEASA